MEIKDVIRVSLDLEKKSFEFFKEAKKQTRRESGKRMFERLSLDERSHIEILFNRYRDYEDLGNVEDFINSSTFKNSDIIEELRRLVDENTADVKAIEIAMELEKKGYNMYKEAAEKAEDGEIKGMFERLKHDEENHYRILDAEYCAITGIPQRFELDTYVRE